MLRSSGLIITFGLMLASCTSGGFQAGFAPGNSSETPNISLLPPVSITLPAVTWGSNQQPTVAPSDAPSGPVAMVPPPPAAPLPATVVPSAPKTPVEKPHRSNKENRAAANALLCVQYDIALRKCGYAVAPYKDEPDKLKNALKECLTAARFPSEPKVCQRQIVSPDEAASIILEGNYTGAPDFTRTTAKAALIIRRQTSFSSTP